MYEAITVEVIRHPFYSIPYALINSTTLQPLLRPQITNGVLIENYKLHLQSSIIWRKFFSQLAQKYSRVDGKITSLRLKEDTFKLHVGHLSITAALSIMQMWQDYKMYLRIKNKCKQGDHILVVSYHPPNYEPKNIVFAQVLFVYNFNWKFKSKTIMPPPPTHSMLVFKRCHF